MNDQTAFDFMGAEPEAAPPPLSVIERITNKYGLFLPGDQRDGYAGRLAAFSAAMDRHHDRIDAALQYTPGTHTFDDLHRLVMSGQLTLWDLDDSFMLTEVQSYPRAAHFHIFLASGNLKTLVDMHADVLELAAALGCAKVTIAGRPGWERALKGHGWVPHLVVLSKEV